MGILPLLLILFGVRLVRSSTCVPSDFKTQCLNMSQSTGYVSTYYNGYCWVMNQHDLKDWHTANSKCQQDYENGRLAFVTIRVELDAIKTVVDLGPGVWSGLTRDSAQPQPTGWQYVSSDGALAYAKDPLSEWSAGSPRPGLDDFALITNDGYIQHNPATLQKYLCQFPEPPTCPNLACFDTVSKYNNNKAASAMGNATIDVFNDVINFRECARRCAKLATCQSFSHNKNTKQCELYWLPAEALTLEAATGFDMFDRNPNFENCNTPEDCFDVCRPAVLSGGSPSYSSQSFPYGSVLDQTQLTLTCDTDKRYINGTTATAAVVSTCDAPNWTPTEIQCQPVCDPIISNGGLSSYSKENYSDGSFPDQTEHTLTCDTNKRYIQGTTASPVVVSTCNASNWNSSDIKCQPVCDPIATSGGSPSYTNQSCADGSYPDQTKLTLTCDTDKRYIQGTAASAVALSTCSAPNWSQNDMSCQHASVCDPILPSPSGGSPTYSNQSYSDGSFPDQTELTLTCDTNKRYIQGTTASLVALSTCNAPNWSSNDMNCAPGNKKTANFFKHSRVSVCQPFPLTEHLSATYSQSLSDSTVASGETVTLECNGLLNLYVNEAKHSDPNVIVSCTAPNWDATDIECGGHILVFGGWADDARASVESFYPEDASNNQLEATLNQVVYGASVEVIANKVMVASGSDYPTNMYLRSTTLYDPVTKTFTATPDLSFPHHVGEAAVIDDVFFLCGGMNPTQTTCEKFTGGTWSSIASMSTRRRRFGVVALNGKLYAIAGFDGSSSMSSVEAYDHMKHMYQYLEHGRTHTRSRSATRGGCS